jgi:hypothetical protein
MAQSMFNATNIASIVAIIYLYTVWKQMSKLMYPLNGVVVDPAERTIGTYTKPSS